MKKTTSVNVKLVALVAILMAIVFSVSALLLGRSTISASAAVSDNCGYNEDNVYVDYSGQGTVINGKLTRDPATINGNFVEVPIYKAAYEPNSDWNWFWNWSWSVWATSNNKTNDYDTYRGEKVTEYQVESRQEYKYRRNESRDVYSTKYYTTYQGTKWYNCWIFLFTSDWSGYGGVKSGYKIVNRYTKSEKSGTKQVTVYDNEWKTSAPFNWAWENKWEAYTSRTTYRYRSLDMKWSDTAQKTTEQVPLNYSLYDRDGNTIGNGIKWDINFNITNELDRDWFSKYILQADLKLERGYHLTQYYLPQSDYVKAIAEIATNHNADWFRTLLVSGLGALLGSIIGGPAGAITSTALVPMLDVLLQQLKNNEIDKFKNTLLEYVAGRDGVVIITTSYCITDPIYRWVDSYFDANNKGYVSMLFDSNKAKELDMNTIYTSYSDSINYMGDISYINDNEVLEVVDRYVNSWF